MPITSEQLKQAINTATGQRTTDVNNNQVQPIGEIRNSLRDFSYDFDAGKIQALTKDQYNQIAPLFGMATQSIDRQFEQGKRDLIDMLSANNPLRQLGKSARVSNEGIGANTVSTISFDGMDNNFADAVKIANALEQTGLSKKTASDQFAKYMSFDPKAQVEAERARAQQPAPSPQVQAAGSPRETATSAEMTAATFTPNDYSTKNGLDQIQKQVFQADTGAIANDAFVNSAFKAFHGRDATPQELASYRNKQVGNVRTEIIGGAQAAGLPTVAAGTVNVSTGILTPQQAQQQGLQKVLRPDQLSSLREDQIVRDNQGGIYLRQDTTTTELRESIAAGKSGAEISGTGKPNVDATTGDAGLINAGGSQPDPKSFIEGMTGEDVTKGFSDFATSAASSIGGYLAQLDAEMSRSRAQQMSEKADMNSVVGRITALTGGNKATEDLETARKNEGLQQKYDTMKQTLSEIEAEKAKLQLGLIQQSNKLAPMGIIGQRQNTLNQQAMSRIGVLTALANIQQDDLNFAKEMVTATVTAMNADRSNQIKSYELLLGLAKDNIVELKDDERALITARTSAVKEAMDNAEKNADRVFDLIKSNPDAALKAKVTLSDSPAVALSKMAPYMSATSERTQVVDLGGRKVLIDLNTGAEIKSYNEVAGVGGGSGTKLKDSEAWAALDSGINTLLDSAVKSGRTFGEKDALKQEMINTALSSKIGNTLTRTDIETRVGAVLDQKVKPAGGWLTKKANEKITIK